MVQPKDLLCLLSHSRVFPAMANVISLYQNLCYEKALIRLFCSFPVLLFSIITKIPFDVKWFSVNERHWNYICFYYGFSLYHDAVIVSITNIFMFHTDTMNQRSAGMGFCERLAMQREPLFFRCVSTLCASPSCNWVINDVTKF